MSAPAWAPARLLTPAPPAQLAPATDSGPTRLQLLTAAAHRPRTPFVLLLVALLGAGIAAILWLSTSAGQDSFVLYDLQARQTALANQEQSLLLGVQQNNTPMSLASRASALGMIADPAPAFIAYPSGRISGDSPLAGHRMHVRHWPADGIVVGPGGPPAPVVAAPASAPVSASRTTGKAAHHAGTGADTPSAPARHHHSGAPSSSHPPSSHAPSSPPTPPSH